MKYLIIITGAITLFLNEIIPFESHFVEEYYSHGLFQWVRSIHDTFLGVLPWANVYALLLFMIFGLFYYIRYYRQKLRRISVKARATKVLFDTLVLVSVTITLFYWLWAFNYKRISFENKNELVAQDITEEWLFHEFQKVHDTLIALRPDVSEDYNHRYVEQNVRLSLSKVLPDMGYEVSGKPRVRQINPKGFLLIWSTAGVYLPFVSEGHIDDGLPELTKPFTLAHEMSHAYGIGQESTCNFTAFIACIRSNDNVIQYSGWLGYFRYLLSSVRRTNKERYKTFYEKKFNKEIISDLDEIYEELNKYPDVLPKLRYFIYDSYLKGHGVKEGMISYSRMIHLARAWQSKHGSF